MVRQHEAAARQGSPPSTCTLCSKQIRGSEPSRPHGDGRSHKRCIQALIRTAAVVAEPAPRAKRPYSQLGRTQRWKRRKQAEQALQAIDCPPLALQQHPAVMPGDVLHLSKSERDRTRTIPHVHIPAEGTIIACKKLLATSHATETGTFAGGAFITDPVRFVSVLCAQSSFLALRRTSTHMPPANSLSSPFRLSASCPLRCISSWASAIASSSMRSASCWARIASRPH